MADDEVSVKITIEEKAALKALTMLTRGLDKFEDKAVSSTKKADSAFASFKGNLAAIGVGKAIGVAGRALKDFGADSIKMAADFEKSIIEINTIMPKNTKLTKKQTNALRDLSKQYGTKPQAQAKSFYQIVSAGTTDFHEAQELLNQSNKLAVGGLSDTSGSIDILTSAINSYGSENLSAKDAVDSLFTSVRLGKTTVSEMSASLALAIPSAKAASVNFDLLNASVATLTTKGFSTATAVTRVNGLLTALARNGDKLGATMDISAVKTDGLVKVLQRLEVRTGGNSDELLKLLGRQEAVQGAQTLMRDGAKDLVRVYGEFSNKAGAANDAFKKIEESASFKYDQLIAEFDDIKITIGNSLLPAFKDLTGEILNNKEVLEKAAGFVADYVSVYASFAISALKAETAIDKVNKKIEENVDASQVLLKRKQDLDSAKGGYFGIFDEANALKIEKINSSLAHQDLVLRELIKRKKELQAQDKAGGEVTDDAGKDTGIADGKNKIAAEKTITKALAEERRKRILELNLLNEEAAIADAQRRSVDKELESTERIEALESLTKHEQTKASIIAGIQGIKDEKILDGESRRLAELKTSKQKELAVEKSSAAAKNLIRQQEISDQNVFFSKAVSLSDSKNKELAAIGRAAGLLQIAMATPPAIASSFNFGARIGGPMLGGVFATIAATAQAAQAAKMAGFANGGVVGGFGGSSVGNDNRTITARDGEMFLNSPQQKRLFDMADGKTGGDNSGLINAIMALANRVNTIEVDGREIARTVRNQRLEGFAV